MLAEDICQCSDARVVQDGCDRRQSRLDSDCSTISGSTLSESTIEGDDSINESFDSVFELDTLIFFDWDDTIFPTSWMFANDLFSEDVELSAHQKQKLESLAQKAQVTLETALQLGKVMIVTNAEDGWIETTCTKFLPSLASTLETVTATSARSCYQEVTEDPAEWKCLTFQREVGFFYGTNSSNQPRNILSVGDSSHELDALQKVTQTSSTHYGKSIKLLEMPSIEQLIEQHEVLSPSLLEVAEHYGDLDVEIAF